ncbi:MAG: RNA 2',3'-cyclic phosphodiesterase [Acidobacteria bacterium]|nr:RNA 2',3'-cyclic phosphodiesterase [Acidobacteriota bacterium]
MRTFIAIEIPAEAKSALTAMQNELRRAGADVTWTNPDNIHLTLKFLGEIDKKLISEVEKVCLETSAEVPAFTMGIKGIGVFPNARHPRVLWVGLSGEIEILERLQEHLDERLTSIGFDSEEKDFQPHLTVGRIRSNKNLHELLARSEVYTLPPHSFVVREIVIMKSDLDPAGVSYSQLARAKMKDQND